MTVTTDAPECRDPRQARHNFELENYTHLLIYTKTDVSEQMLASVNPTTRRLSDKWFTGFRLRPTVSIQRLSGFSRLQAQVV